MRRLYRGETNWDFIGTRKRWYLASVVLILLCLGSIVFRGFNWGIEFSGGSSFTVPKPANATLEQAERAVESAGAEVQTAQEVGRGGTAKYVIKTGGLNQDEVSKVKDKLAEELGVKASDVNDSAVSSSWGGQVTNKALTGLAVFLVAVSAYIWIRFEQKMAIAAILALLHDLTLTAGAYSMIGFEVTPSTIIGLLTILGFSLYDTVVVFDKVEENTKGILGGSRTTYGEAANLAVNQTLMRSINTTLISLLPVAGLLFVGAGLLGVGTLKDLALVLFVGLAAGAYSSLFLATPWLVDLKEREPRYAALRQRVLAKRGGTAAAAAKARPEAATAASAESDEEPAAAPEPATASAGARPSSAGATQRPPQRRRPAGGKSGRPSGSKRKR
jgi:preprotein translocase subunit SecF